VWQSSSTGGLPDLSLLIPTAERRGPRRWAYIPRWAASGAASVDRHGMVSLDLKRSSVSARLVGQQVVMHLDANGRCMQVLHEQQMVTALPLKGIVGHRLSFEQFLTQMLHQARAQARLRSLQARKYRTAAFTAPELYDVLALTA
jgi:hypothetical protein